MVKYEPADRRFGSIHVNIVGPLPPCEGFRYLFTVVDRFSRWPEAIPLIEATSISCCRALLRSWVSRHGAPDEIITDRGAQFTSAMWSDMVAGLGATPNTTTAFHPQANGLVERMHRQLKAALKARLDTDNWMEDLPLVLLGMRSAWKANMDSSPAEAVYGAALRLLGQFIPGFEATLAGVRKFIAACAAARVGDEEACYNTAATYAPEPNLRQDRKGLNAANESIKPKY